jgi:hypothetical protein
MRLAAIALALALPAVADARPLTLGAGLGRTQSKANADGEASGTWQLFGRLGLTPRLAVQLEVQKIADPSVDVRSGTALLVVELGRWGKLVPLLVAGAGIDRASSGYYYEANATHKEGGFGLEYRAEGGLTIGADLRLGGRSVYEKDHTVPAETNGLWAPYMLTEGEYRSARVTAAIRF